MPPARKASRQKITISSVLLDALGRAGGKAQASGALEAPAEHHRGAGLRPLHLHLGLPACSRICGPCNSSAACTCGPCTWGINPCGMPSWHSGAPARRRGRRSGTEPRLIIMVYSLGPCDAGGGGGPGVERKAWVAPLAGP